MTRKTIIIAIPNAAQRAQLSIILEDLPDFRVIARTGDLMNTYNEVEERLPNAVLIADSLACLPEFEVMRALFAALDVRWLVVTSPNRFGTAQARAPGAPGSDLFAVPADASMEVVANQLYSLTRTAPSRPLSKRLTAPPEPLVPSPRPSAPRPEQNAPSRPVIARPPASPLARPGPSPEHVILIGSSTGGVDALLSVLSHFTKDCPPTLIVQHTGVGFGESLAGLLNRQCAAQVMLASGPGSVDRGQIMIGAGLRSHLVLTGGKPFCYTLEDGAPISGHMPSVDMLFQSAVGIAPFINAAVLTGMGRDGAEGLRDLRMAGARTIAQDEATSVVYGMPRVAMEIGGADVTLPLDRIGPALLAAPRSLGHKKKAV